MAYNAHAINKQLLFDQSKQLYFDSANTEPNSLLQKLFQFQKFGVWIMKWGIENLARTQKLDKLPLYAELNHSFFYSFYYSMIYTVW